MESAPQHRSLPRRRAPVDARKVLRLLDSATGMSLSEAAAQISAAGLPVFPCRSGQKRPLTRHGLLDATDDPVQVAAWWRRWPAANIGVPTGAVSGLVVLDVDVRPAGSGFPTFEALTRQGLAAGWAGLVRTPSGGLHAYYPAAWQARSWQAADRHMDFRGDGGYVVIPPSRLHRPDGTTVSYSVACIAENPPQPLRVDVIRDRLLPRTRAAHDAPTPAARDSDRTTDTDRLAAWVAARGEGERNRGLFWAACRLAETGATLEQIHAALGPPAEHTGLPGPEIAATIRSATRTASPGSRGSGRPEVAAPVRAPPTQMPDPPERPPR